MVVRKFHLHFQNFPGEWIKDEWKISRRAQSFAVGGGGHPKPVVEEHHLVLLSQFLRYAESFDYGAYETFMRPVGDDKWELLFFFEKGVDGFPRIYEPLTWLCTSYAYEVKVFHNKDENNVLKNVAVVFPRAESLYLPTGEERTRVKGKSKRLVPYSHGRHVLSLDADGFPLIVKP